MRCVQDTVENTTLATFPYRGMSMRPTFKHGDVLLVAPEPLAAIRPGDVVVFSHAQRSEGMPVVVHRVLSCHQEGLITCGDNSAIPDAPITAEHLIGRVVAVQRDGRIHPVWGGNAGRLWAALLRLRRRSGPFVLWPYRRLKASGIVQRLWRPPIARVCLTTENGRLVKYVHRRRVVACWWPDEGEFWCRRPYDLVLEPPTGENPGILEGR